MNVFETGRPEGHYSAVSVYNDGPHDIRQITYGRSQTTEHGNLRALVRDYARSNATFAAPRMDRAFSFRRWNGGNWDLSLRPMTVRGAGGREMENDRHS